MRALLLAGVAGVLVLPIAKARADVYQFTLSGTESASFQLSSTPTPATSSSIAFSVSNISVDFMSGSTMLSNGDLYFYNFSGGGGFSIYNHPITRGYAELSGLQLFTGSTSDPTFVRGTYDLIETDAPNDPTETLVISTAATAVPEPATLALLGTGMIGLLATRRKRPMA